MWKLQQLVKEKEEADKKAQSGNEGPKEGEDLQIKRSNSKVGLLHSECAC